MNLVSVLEGIISSVPEAIQLYNKIAPHISHVSIPQDIVDEVNEIAPSVHSAVETAHQAIANLIQAHSGENVPFSSKPSA